MKYELDAYTIQILIQNGLLNEKDLEKLNCDLKVLLHNAVDEWDLAAKKAYAHETALIHVTYVKRFFKWYFDVQDFSELPKDTVLPNINEDVIQKWLQHMASNGYEYTTIRRAKYGIKVFCQFMQDKYGFCSNINFNNIIIPKGSLEIEALRDDEIRKMAEYAPELQTKAIILWMYETAMHRNEVSNCKKEHIDFDNLTVTIYEKNHRTRIGCFTIEVRRVILEYLADWEKQVEDINARRLVQSRKDGVRFIRLLSNYLFQTVRSEKISNSTIHKAIKECAYRYFLDKAEKEGKSKTEANSIAKEKTKSFHAEVLRNSRRAYWFAQGKTVDQVQAIIGDETRWSCKRLLKVASNDCILKCS